LSDRHAPRGPFWVPRSLSHLSDQQILRGLHAGLLVYQDGFVYASASGGAPFTRVQSNTAVGTSSTPSVDIGNVPAAGNLVVASIAITANDTITLSGGTAIPTDGDVTSGTGLEHNVFYKIADGSAGSDVLTGSCGASHSWRITAVEYHDAGGGTWTLDKTSHASSGAGSTADSGTTAATTQADEVWVAALETNGNQTQSAPTNGFSQVDGAGVTTPGGYLYEKIVSATGTANVSASLSTNGRSVGTVATFYTVVPFVARAEIRALQAVKRGSLF
jgi:hypothetical protein